MFKLSVPYCDLDQIYKSQMCPDWQKLSKGRYLIMKDKNKYTRVDQVGESLFFTCKADDVYDVWFKYFDMKIDYGEIYSHVHNSELKNKIEKSKGIRLINENDFVILVKAIIFSDYGERFLRGKFDRIKRTLGIPGHSSVMLGCAVRSLCFPDVKDFIAGINDVEGISKSTKKKLYNAAYMYLFNWLDFDYMRNMNDKQKICSYLMSFDFMDMKSIRYLLFYCFHFLNVYDKDDKDFDDYIWCEEINYFDDENEKYKGMAYLYLKGKEK